MKNKTCVVLIVCFIALGACKKDPDLASYNKIETIVDTYKDVPCYTSFDYPKEKTKVCGWIVKPMHDEIDFSAFQLADDPSVVLGESSPQGIYISCNNPSVLRALEVKMKSSILSKKCYISGALRIENYPINGACFTAPEIIVLSADDVIFK